MVLHGTPLMKEVNDLLNDMDSAYLSVLLLLDLALTHYIMMYFLSEL